jgi:phage-related protein
MPYRVEVDAVVIADVFSKTSQTTPMTAIKNGQRRLRAYDDARIRTRRTPEGCIRIT